MDENSIINKPIQALLDVTDKSLYSFDERNGLVKFREAANISAYDNFFSLIEMETIEYVVNLFEKIPHLNNIIEAIKGKTEFVASLSEKAKRKLESNEWHWVASKDGSGLLTTLQDNLGNFAEQVKINMQTIRSDMMNAIINLMQQKNLDALMEKITELTDTVDKIAAGQYNDRISVFYEARQTYIEAMAMTDYESRRIALLNSAHSANKAISSLQQTIKFDLNSLLGIKDSKKLNEKTRLIARCFSILNNSVQISINAYSALGENRALLATITSYQCFVEQSLLVVPELKDGNKYAGCTLAEIMHSCANTQDVDWKCIPYEIVNTCDDMIKTEKDTVRLITEGVV